ncbi:MAG: patatin-like phospholipase family protein [Xanthomonadaceae bacterium]|nr:patatin-like phospholipase family protein [Xanthomonadaceae bacterium]
MNKPASKSRTRKPAAAPRDAAGPTPRSYPTVALVLQGGGALGSYQAGVYEALHEAGRLPNWVAGISIGALNAAIIAGNAPAHRVAKLREFWDTICKPPFMPAPLASPQFDDLPWPLPLRHGLSGVAAMRAMFEGQAGFFLPRVPAPPFAPWRAGPVMASWYDTTPLRSTLERLVDFDRVNDPRTIRVSVGAVNVRSGNFEYFDSTRQTLRAEHFMASGALPPGFPAVEIDGEFYWDGGMVSNTPLYQVLLDRPSHDALIFQVDLWSAAGEPPHDLAQVAARSKDIQYSSRTRLVTEYMQREHEHQRLLHEVMALVPESRRGDPAYLRAETRSSGALTNLIHLIYRDKPYEGHYKDFEFSANSMRRHWNSGMDDMRNTLSHPHWLDAPDPAHPFVTHDVHRRGTS